MPLLVLGTSYVATQTCFLIFVAGMGFEVSLEEESTSHLIPTHDYVGCQATLHLPYRCLICPSETALQLWPLEILPYHKLHLLFIPQR